VPSYSCLWPKDLAVRNTKGVSYAVRLCIIVLPLPYLALLVYEDKDKASWLHDPPSVGLKGDTCLWRLVGLEIYPLKSRCHASSTFMQPTVIASPAAALSTRGNHSLACNGGLGHTSCVSKGELIIPHEFSLSPNAVPYFIDSSITVSCLFLHL
jgi:hypothetical protein